MVDSDGSLFDQVVGDMKVMAPLWEDLLLKSSKFYNVVKQTAFTGDLFLDSFQKIADAVTNSKGATRDIGVSFTKIVMRQRAVENKLKVFVGILADNFITPLQDSLDEWKKNCSQLEKDHTKDYKRLKGELKKSVTDTCKLKKKVTKKMGSREYTEQFREAVKLSTSLQKSLEEQEKGYLRKLMIEERTRVTQFFHYYKPCMEQQLALLADIEQLQSILEETKMQCESPYLPQIYEEVVNDYKLPDYLNFNGTRKESTNSPPGSPSHDIRMRFGSLSCPPTQTKIPLRRSLTTTSFNRNPSIEPPIPVSLPSSPMQRAHDMSVSSSSFSSSSSSVDQCNTYDTVNTEEFDGGMESCSPTSYTGDGNEESYMEQQMNNQGAVRPLSKAHTSWSSIGTSDSSGIGSYNSLSSHHRSNSLSSHNRSAHLQSRNYSASECDPIETDMSADYQNIDMLRYGAPGGFHQASTANGNQAKYATIDRSHFRRNKAANSGLGVDLNGKPRSNSVDVGGEPCSNETVPTTTLTGTATIDHQQNSGNNYNGGNMTTDDIALNNQNHVNQKVEMNYPKVNKYATIDRSQLRRNQAQMAAALKELELKQKTNGSEVVDHVEEYPNFPDYKMNLPKSKSNTMGRQNIYTNAKKPTIFQIFDGQNIGQNIGEKVLRRISPERPFTNSDVSNGSDGEGRVMTQNGTPNGVQVNVAPQNGLQNGVHGGLNGQNGAVLKEQFIPPTSTSFQQVGAAFTPTIHSSPQHTTSFNTMPPPPPPTEKPALKPKPVVNSRLPCQLAPVVEPKPHTLCNDPEPAKPGSFAAQLQERRNSVLKKTLQ